jgi:hypothetical protein
MSIVSLALNEAQASEEFPAPKAWRVERTLSPKASGGGTVQQQLREQQPSPLFLHSESRRKKKESTVSLLTSALAVSSIHCNDDETVS